MKPIPMILIFILLTNVSSQINFTPHSITSTTSIIQKVHLLDMDDDDVDILYVTRGISPYYEGELVLRENDGEENFTNHKICDIVEGYSIFGSDVDGDGDKDILVASECIIWYKNNGDYNFTPDTINTKSDRATDIYAIDIDNDNDIDILSVYGYHVGYGFFYRVSLFKNDGSENFEENYVSNTDFAWEIDAADMDNDEDLDVFILKGNHIIVWCKNNENEDFSYPKEIIKQAYGLNLIDLDGDDDMDLICLKKTSILNNYYIA